MTSIVKNIAFDCADAYALAQFWSKVTGHPVDEYDQPGADEVSINIPGAATLYFNQVPESKTGKNRVHVCLQPEDSRDAEVERLLGLGATLVADRRNPDGTGWAVLGDPEGNEFCVLRSAAERAATS